MAAAAQVRERSLRDLMIVAQIFCAFYLTGLVWIIQLTHYPAFASIDAAKFEKFHLSHSNALSLLAGPVMLLELGTAVGLALNLETLWLLNLTSVVIPFAATFVLSVPCHNELGRGLDERVVTRLVRTNWVRTLAWSLRSAGWIAFLSQVSLG